MADYVLSSHTGLFSRLCFVQIRNVTKEYNQKGKTYRALDAIDLDIEAGTLVALLGPSGSGTPSLM